MDMLAEAGWLLRGAASGVIAQVFPPTCPCCGRLAARQGGLCAACWCDLVFIERPYCEVLGTPFAYEIGKGALSAEAIANPPVFSRHRSACIYNDRARQLVSALKFNDRTELAPMMATWMTRAGRELLEDADGVVPVPLHLYRRLSRRYNQAAELGRSVAATSARPFLADALVRRRNTPHQIGLGRTARETNLRGAFIVPDHAREEVAGKRLVLVDDVFTTGSTMAAASRALLKAGAAEVAVLSFATAVSDII